MDFSSILTDWEDFSTVWDSMVANVESELLGTFTADYVNPDSNFYETACETAKNNFNVFFGEEEYIYSMKKVIKEVI